MDHVSRRVVSDRYTLHEVCLFLQLEKSPPAGFWKYCRFRPEVTVHSSFTCTGLPDNALANKQTC